MKKDEIKVYLIYDRLNYICFCVVNICIYLFYLCLYTYISKY